MTDVGLLSQCRTKADMINPEKFTQIKERQSEIVREMSDPNVATDPRRMAELGREHQTLKQVIDAFDAVRNLRSEIEDLREMIREESETELVEIAQAIVTTMEQDSTSYLAQLGTAGALITVIDKPSPPAENPLPLTQRLDLPVRLFLAFCAGVALTFLIDYLDDSVRGKTELEALGIPVLGEVPKK